MPPSQRRSIRFRTDVTPLADEWEATIYDMDDHGPDLPYAVVACSSLAEVLRQASHYILMAE